MSKQEQNRFTLSDEQFEMLMERFKQRMPDFVDFRNPGEQFQKQETDYKRKALRRFEDFGGAKRLREMIDAGNAAKALAVSASFTAGCASYSEGLFGAHTICIFQFL